MEGMKISVETAVQSPEQFRNLLRAIEGMSAFDRNQMFMIVETIENQLIGKNEGTTAQIKNRAWHSLLDFLTMGLDVSLQGLLHQSAVK